jgi:hypothetical protein
MFRSERRWLRSQCAALQDNTRRTFQQTFHAKLFRGFDSHRSFLEKVLQLKHSSKIFHEHHLRANVQAPSRLPK